MMFKPQQIEGVNGARVRWMFAITLALVALIASVVVSSFPSRQVDPPRQPVVPSAPAVSPPASSVSSIVPTSLTEGLVERIERDLSRGEDLVISSYVGLWYTNQRDPAHNLYWGNLYGHAALFGRSAEIRERLPFLIVTDYTVSFERSYPGDPIAVKVVQAPVPPGPDGSVRRGRIVIVNLAYADMESAVRDLGLHLKTGVIPPALAHEATVAPLLARSYVMGYWGHNIHYGGLSADELESIAKTMADGPRGVFVVGCQSARWFPQKFLDKGIEPVLFTTTNMAPEAYIALALYDGLARGLGMDQTRRNVARAYQKYQGLQNPPLSLFVNDQASIERRQALIPARQNTPAGPGTSPP